MRKNIIFIVISFLIMPFGLTTGNELNKNEEFSLETLLLLHSSINELLSSAKKCKKELKAFYTSGAQCQLFFDSGERYRKTKKELKEINLWYVKRFEGYIYYQDMAYHRTISVINTNSSLLKSVLRGINNHLEKATRYNWNGWNNRHRKY